MLTGEQSTGIFAGRVITQSLINAVRCVCVCVCVGGCVCVCGCVCCMKFSLVDDFIFLNLLCNFTVNNCIILFQVAKKPVMTT